MSQYTPDPEELPYWRDRAFRAEHKNNSAFALAAVVVGVCLSIALVSFAMYVGQREQFLSYREAKVTYEPHSVTQFNHDAMKTLMQTREKLELDSLRHWDAPEDKALTASFQGCALNLYTEKEWSPEKCHLAAFPAGSALRVDALAFPVTKVTVPEDGLPEQRDFQKRLEANQKEEALATAPEGRTEAPYITTGQPHALGGEATRAYVYAVGGNGGDWVVYIFSEHVAQD